MVELTENKVIKEIKETKKIFNKLRNFSREEIRNIREKSHKKESVNKYLKEIKQKNSLTKK